MMLAALHRDLQSSRRLVAKCKFQRTAAVSSPQTIFWFFQVPNFLLAALMYTLFGRVLLGLMLDPASTNKIWRFVCRVTDPYVALVA
jgi:hypothetical protein